MYAAELSCSPTHKVIWRPGLHSPIRQCHSPGSALAAVTAHGMPCRSYTRDPPDTDLRATLSYSFVLAPEQRSERRQHEQDLTEITQHLPHSTSGRR